jgi:hypothetical protein
VGKKLKAKSIGGKYLNASMLLSLALEYTETLNAKETPTILTALDRVVQAESVKILDQTLELFKQDCEETFSEENMPMPSKDFHKKLRKLVSRHSGQL